MEVMAFFSIKNLSTIEYYVGYSRYKTGGKRYHTCTDFLQKCKDSWNEWIHRYVSTSIRTRDGVINGGALYS